MIRTGRRRGAGATASLRRFSFTPKKVTLTYGWADVYGYAESYVRFAATARAVGFATIPSAASAAPTMPASFSSCAVTI
jgi:hypothetical protein